MNNKQIKWTNYICASLYVGKKSIDEIFKLINVNHHQAILGDDLIDVSTYLHHCLYLKQQYENRRFKYGVIAILTLLLGLILFLSKAALILAITIAVVFIAVLFMTISDVEKDYEIGEKLIKKTIFEENDLPKLKPKYAKDLIQLQNWICSNVVYYGDYSPFLGEGDEIGGWSFTLNIDKPKIRFGENAEIKPFELSELYTNIEESIANLSIENLSIDSKVYVSGKNIRDNKTFMEGRIGPLVTTLPDSLVEDFICNRKNDGKYYKTITIEQNNFSGKLTTLVHFFKNDSILYSEVLFFAMPFRIIQYNTFQNWKIFEVKDKYHLKESFITAIGNLYFGMFYPLALFSKFSESLWKKSKRRKIIENIETMPHYNYGALYHYNSMIRGQYQNFNHEQNVIMYKKIIEKRLLGIIEDFLSEKGIDTKEFNERETNILNNGVFMSGGSLEAENFVVGNKATIKTKLRKKDEKTKPNK